MLEDPLLDKIVRTEHEIVEIRNALKTYQDGLPFLRRLYTGTSSKALALRRVRDEYYQSLNTELDYRLLQEPGLPCMRANLLKAKVSAEELNMVCMTFISAGMAPTVATLYWSLAFLAQRPDIQSEAMVAIAAHWESHPPEHDLEDNARCGYIVALVKECLR
jgi:3-hydroxyphenylacetate 6-hydroxylase